MQCVVLAGGLGTRMHSVTKTLPKALIPVAGEPFIDHQLRWLSAHGVEEVVLSVGHLGDMIEAHVGSGARHGIHVRYVNEGAELRGTGGALRLALDRGVLGDEFLVTYGDSYLPIDFGMVGEALRRSGQPALMTVFRNEGRWDTSNVVFDDATGAIVVYDKARRTRPPEEFEYIDYGVSALRRDTLAREIPPETRFDLADLYHRLSLRGELAGQEVAQRFYEIGSPAGLAELERHLMSSSPGG
ncbi:MAG TPA: nucleotidyltransferase family protein [Polyangiaceae bacterium]